MPADAAVQWRGRIGDRKENGTYSKFKGTHHTMEDLPGLPSVLASSVSCLLLRPSKSDSMKGEEEKAEDVKR
ncbi:hypothetical protein Dda_7473 [Drechslerella dactyloides]|uniref:Uncharacterized protein n=1 Tax=Drechslerella dactyloides TaxID=74499 RepID=A0AAD6IU29_DREDA|nr:hypothetical protein Dda_7473 [Drechslerella dactyloides]